MATLSRTLAWKIPWTKEPGELQSLGPQRAGPDWATEHKQNTQWNIIQPQEMIWRREWQPTPVSLPGESHGQRSLVGYSPWGHKELDTTERLTLLLQEMGDILTFVTTHVSTFAKQGKSGREREVLHDIPYI